MCAISRRHFLRTNAASLASIAFGGHLLGNTVLAASLPKQGGMTIDLNFNRLGIKIGQIEAIDLAYCYGFESVAPQLEYLTELSDAEIQKLLDNLNGKGLVFSTTSLPVDFRRDRQTFHSELKQLPNYAATLRKANVTRVGTWIMPTHDTLTYRKNFDRHVRRIREVAKILEDQGLRLGLEYIGPKTSWASKKYPFVHTLAETKELVVEIGAPNVGFILDSWHWYTAHESEADLLALDGEDVVAVDINDAPAGVPIDQQEDLSRELPLATGVIDINTFLRALQKIGYKGPVRAEPFDDRLNELPPNEAVAITARAMGEAFALIR